MTGHSLDFERSLNLTVLPIVSNVQRRYYFHKGNLHPGLKAEC